MKHERIDKGSIDVTCYPKAFSRTYSCPVAKNYIGHGGGRRPEAGRPVILGG